mgnify:FL=1
MDVIMSNEKETIENELNNEKTILIKNALNTLDERSKIVIEMYYGFNSDKKMTLSEIGEIFSLSKERIRQICNKSLEQIKDYIVCQSKSYIF